MIRHFGLGTSGSALGGTEQRTRSHLAHDTQRDLNSLPRLPSKSILHRENVPDSPLDVGALHFVAAFAIFVVLLFALSFGLLRSIGL